MLKRWTVSKDMESDKNVPLHKKGAVDNITNYRPISLISAFAKLLEKILHSRIYNQIKHQITPAQHGFIEKKSTVTNLLTKVQFITRNLNQCVQTDIIYTDLHKAFDSVDHGILLNKMARMGFSAKLLEFFKSYLNNRPMYVYYSRVKSYTFLANSGVPQGANLATLLFSIYINDVTQAMNIDVLLYADDLKLLKTIYGPPDAVQLQRQLDKLISWCNANKLILNKDKCRVISYTLSKSPIQFRYQINTYELQRSVEIYDLGVTFQSDMSYNKHITNIITGAFKVMGIIIRNCNQFQNICTLRTLYLTMVRPKLEYASVVWSPYCTQAKSRLEALQRRYLKYLHYRKHGEYPQVGISQEYLQCEFLIPSLEYRRKLSDLTFITNLINGRIDDTCLLSQLQILVHRTNAR